VWALLVLSLAACTSGADAVPAGSGSAARDEAAQAPAEAAETASASASVAAAEGAGLLQNPEFVDLGKGPEQAVWSTGQHALGGSYEFTVEQGVLSIRRTGAEPWGMVAQDLSVDALAGKRLRLSMDLAADLDDSWGAPIQPSGLVVKVTGYGPNDPPMMGERILLAQVSEPGIAAGQHDWQTHSLEFEVPSGHHVSLRAGVQLTSGGVLRVRNPRLELLDD